MGGLDFGSPKMFRLEDDVGLGLGFGSPKLSDSRRHGVLFWKRGNAM